MLDITEVIDNLLNVPHLEEERRQNSINANAARIERALAQLFGEHAPGVESGGVNAAGIKLSLYFDTARALDKMALVLDKLVDLKEEAERRSVRFT